MKQLWSLIEKVNDWFWNRVARSTSVSSRSLSVYRIIVGLFLAVNATKTFHWIADVPQAFFKPPVLSFANLFSEFPDKDFLLLIDMLIAISIVCITVGIRAKIATLVYVFASIIGNSFLYSFGKIDHTITIYLVLFCLSFSGWGSHLALVPDKRVAQGSSSRSLGLFSICICFAMFTAGFEKSLNWVDFDVSTSGFMSWFNQGYYSLGRRDMLAPYVSLIPIFFLEFIDYAAVVFELSPFFFLLCSRRAWKFWLFVACCFHLSVALTLNIFFTENILAYLVFIDYSAVYYKLRNLVRAVPKKLAVNVALGFSFLFIVAKIGVIFNYIDYSYTSVLSNSNKYFSLPIAVTGLIIIGLALFKNVDAEISNNNEM